MRSLLMAFLISAAYRSAVASPANAELSSISSQSEDTPHARAVQKARARSACGTNPRIGGGMRKTAVVCAVALMAIPLLGVAAAALIIEYSPLTW